jgi:hypothetical protein
VAAIHANGRPARIAPGHFERYVKCVAGIMLGPSIDLSGNAFPRAAEA